MSEVFCKDCIWHQNESGWIGDNYFGWEYATWKECQHDACFKRHGVTGDNIRIKWSMHNMDEKALNKNCDCQYYKAREKRQ